MARTTGAAAIAAERLASQGLLRDTARPAARAVADMVALQAQDLPSALLAIGLRSPGARRRTVERALNAGQLVRTHLLRPTWHIVAAADLRWLLALTAPRIRSVLRSRHAQLGLGIAEVTRATAVIEKALQGGVHRGRGELLAALSAARLPLDGNRLSHYLLCAELEGVACSGRLAAGEPTWALLDERVPPRPALPREEALALLARRYFSSRGPATPVDFTWWSGLTAGDARLAVAAAGNTLAAERIDGREYLLPRSRAGVAGRRGPAARLGMLHFLPAFDEMVISYADRRATLPTAAAARAVSANGFFRAVVTLDGRAVGTWRFAGRPGQHVLEVSWFPGVHVPAGDEVRRAVDSIEAFLGSTIGFRRMAPRS